MADQPQAEQAGTETQAEPTPSSEQKTSEPVAEAASPKGDSTSQAKAEESQLPEGTKERTTQQFEKLKDDLRKERERRLRAEQMFSTMPRTQTPQQQQQPQQPQQPEQPTVPNWYDQESGTVDVNRLQQYNSQLETQVSQLNQRVQTIAQSEQRKQEIETYSAYPDLDPNSNKFNQDFSDAVQGALTSSFLRGENPTFKETADKIANFAGKQVKAAEKKGATEAIEQLTPKEQASLEATGRSDKRTEVREDIQQLQKRTRTGDVDAIMERMKGLTS